MITMFTFKLAVFCPTVTIVDFTCQCSVISKRDVVGVLIYLDTKQFPLIDYSKISLQG